jgi:predicted S18 family serine protease
MIRTALLLSLVSLSAFAQNSAISISCGECGVFQSIQVVFDGQDMGANQPMRITNVAPGDHEVKVIKWKSPFATEVLYTGIVNFPAGTELRAKATKNKLDIYGRGDYTPPAPVVQGPSAEQVAAARDLIAEAKESLDDLQEKLEDSDEDCTTKLIGRLGSLEDALSDAERSTGRGEVDAAIQKAFDAQKVIMGKCSKKASKKWSKPMDRVVARLQGASKYL